MDAPKYIVVVHEPDDVAAKIITASSIRKAVSTSIYYLIPSPTLVVFDGDIKNVTDSEAGSKTVPPTFTIGQRDVFVGKMDKDIESYRLDCQKLVNLAPDEATADLIATSFDMELKPHNGGLPRQDEVLDGPIPNSALYRMKGTGPHQIQISFDAGTTFQDIAASRTGKSIITDLTLKVDIWLRNRQLLAHAAVAVWGTWTKFTPRQ